MRPTRRVDATSTAKMKDGLVAQRFKGTIPQSDGITLACLCAFNDFLGDELGQWVSAIGQLEGAQGTFKSQCYHADLFGTECLVLQQSDYRHWLIPPYDTGVSSLRSILTVGE